MQLTLSLRQYHQSRHTGQRTRRLAHRVGVRADSPTCQRRQTRARLSPLFKLPKGPPRATARAARRRSRVQILTKLGHACCYASDSTATERNLALGMLEGRRRRRRLQTWIGTRAFAKPLPTSASLAASGFYIALSTFQPIAGRVTF